MSHRFPRLAFAAAAAAVLALAATASTAFAAAHTEMKAPQMFIVHVEKADPSKLADYEAITKEFIALVKANRQAMPLLSFTALQGEDLAFSLIAPIRGFADVESIFTAFEGMGKAVGEQRWTDLMRRGGATYTSADDSVWMEVPEASYWPPGAEVTLANAGYVQLDFYRVKPGWDDAAAQVAASWRELFASKNVPYGYSVYRLVLGSDGPLWAVSTPAKDPAHLATIQETARKTIGNDAWQAQMAKTLAITRGVDSKRYWVRRDLSLAPAAAAGK